MTYAAITGWGKCMPPAVLSNADLATFLETDDEWITTRTGIRERRVSHVSGIDMAHVACARALACAGLDAADVDLRRGQEDRCHVDRDDVAQAQLGDQRSRWAAPPSPNSPV